MRRLVGIASVALLTAGAVVALDVGLTLAWGEPMSTLRGWLAQRQAANELVALEESFADVAPRGDRRSVGRLARLQLRQSETGQPIGRLLIAAIDLNIVAVEGTDSATLKKGPGRYPETAFPGQGRTVAIAGHRTTYLAPFRRINELGPGDEVVLEMPYGTFTYRFAKQRIVDPSQVGVVRDVGYERMVLTACHPLYSAAQRIVVFARLQDVEPAVVPRSGREAASPRPESELPEVPTPSLGPAWAGAGGLALIAVVGLSLGLAGASTGRGRRGRRH